MATRKTRIHGAPLSALYDSYMLTLTQRNLSPRTVQAHGYTAGKVTRWLKDNGHPDDTEGVAAEHIRAFLRAETLRTSATTAHTDFRNLRTFFKWLGKEGERQAENPMLGVEPPKVSSKVRVILPADDQRALLATCEDATFEGRRDRAILLLFMDTGVRVSGMVSMRTDQVDMRRRVIKVVLKGGDEWLVPLGRTTTVALDRYLRARARHLQADSPWLWLGIRGTSTASFGCSGMEAMVRRRRAQAGLSGVTPHWFRRSATHAMLDAGMSETAVMNIAGWKTPDMIRVYAGALEAERARAVHAVSSPADRLAEKP